MYVLFAFLLTITSFGIFGYRAFELFKKISAGQSDPSRFNNKGKRFKNMLVEVLSHTKMLNFTVTGVAHWFVMIGFGALLGTLVTAYGQLVNPEWVLPIIGHFVGY
ncbi:MAG: Fe-S oxidoreductase, partial [Alphaproteobacteria bacterium]|nr:Fe-S oxidoreductase [Alphaproteobacteria bacterium]